MVMHKGAGYDGREDKFEEAIRHERYLPKAKCKTCGELYFVLKNTTLYSDAMEGVIRNKNINYFKQIQYKDCHKCWTALCKSKNDSGRIMDQREHDIFLIGESRRRSLTKMNGNITIGNDTTTVLFYVIEVDENSNMKLSLKTRIGEGHYL
jgi:hypothetical protein